MDAHGRIWGFEMWFVLLIGKVFLFVWGPGGEAGSWDLLFSFVIMFPNTSPRDSYTQQTMEGQIECTAGL